MRDLTGKYCIVTGAGKGIGKAIAKRFLLDSAYYHYKEIIPKSTVTKTKEFHKGIPSFLSIITITYPLSQIRPDFWRYRSVPLRLHIQGSVPV